MLKAWLPRSLPPSHKLVVPLTLNSSNCILSGMKLSISLSDTTARRLGDYASSLAAGNASIVVEVALKRLFETPGDELKRLVHRQKFDRRASTRSGWAKAYWDVLGGLMGQPNQDVFGSPYSPRRFGDFYAVLLMNHIGQPDDEDDPFFPHIGPMPVTPESPSPVQWTFDRSASPVAAAEAVAAKLREYGVPVPPVKGGEQFE